MALPICTAPEATVALAASRESDEKVAPWMPSRPVRPPSTKTWSSLRAAFAIRPRGMKPTLPQKTSGLVR
jgi:hypothetical protein